MLLSCRHINLKTFVPTTFGSGLHFPREIPLSKVRMAKTSVLQVCLLALVVGSTIGHHQQTLSIFNGNGRATIHDGEITFKLANMKGEYTEKKISMKDSSIGTPLITNSHDFFSAVWDNGAEIKMNFKIESANKVFHTVIKPSSSVGIAESCYSLEENYWYGGAETYVQAWPIQDQDIPYVAFVPNGQNGGVLDRYFLSSFAQSVFLDNREPIFVQLDSLGGNLCFSASFADPYRNTDGRELTLTTDDVLAADILAVYKYGLANYFNRPLGIPAEKVFSDPIWSTWAVYKTAIDQDTVLNFSQQVDDNGFTASQIEIDDNWETCYGSEAFDTTKFPDPAGMVSTLKQRGHDVTLWVHPFVNTDCYMFQEGDSNKYFVTTNGTDVTGITSWWEGSSSGIIDVTKSDAAAWWYQRLDGLRTQVGITAYKFDAGETHWLPKDAYLNSSENIQPGIYSTEYARFANQFGGQVEARVGYRSQDVAIFIRELDRDSRWGLDNGLHSVITSALHMGLVGSPFVLPDYIGGNAYGSEHPDRELFIRWVEVNAFLPTMQFSITPWSYDDEVVQICKDMVALHKQVLSVIIAAANQATVDGSPIIRPLWWIAPTDDNALTSNDQFLVGDTYLVAPVITPNTTERDIYLPQGNWVDELRGGTIVGPVLLSNYTVALNEIAYFSVSV